MTTQTDTKYQLLHIEDLCLSESMSEKEVIKYFSDMVKDINADFDEDLVIYKDIKDLISHSPKEYGYIIKPVEVIAKSYETLAIIENAIANNNTWTVKHKDTSIKIKPLAVTSCTVTFNIYRPNIASSFYTTNICIYDDIRDMLNILFSAFTGETYIKYGTKLYVEM